jgi:branched-chain amino acid transport system substrate-binding protein
VFAWGWFIVKTSSVPFTARFVAALAALATTAVACSAPVPAAPPAVPTAAAAPTNKADIVVGQVSTLSGGIPFVEVPKGVQAYFDSVNKQGGINGRKLKFSYYDDKADPSEAAQDARKLVLNDNAIAMVGNTSLVDCDTNRTFYESKNVGVIGIGPQPSCFGQKNWMPINTGPYVSNIVLLHYAFDTLHAQHVCITGQSEPTSIPAYQYQLADFEKTTGHKLTMATFTNDPSQNPTPQVVQAKNAGCDALIVHTVPPNFVAFVQAAKSVGLDATILCLGSAYDESVPQALGPLAEPGALGPNSKGLFVSSELAPWSTDDAALADMKSGLKNSQVQLNFWSQSGWVSAAVFVDALKQVNGDVISTDDMLKALQNMKPYSTPQAGAPLAFGSGESHSPNLSNKMLTIKAGQWVVADQNWVTVPLPPFPPKS